MVQKIEKPSPRTLPAIHRTRVGVSAPISHVTPPVISSTVDTENRSVSLLARRRVTRAIVPTYAVEAQSRKARLGCAQRLIPDLCATSCAAMSYLSLRRMYETALINGQ